MVIDANVQFSGDELIMIYRAGTNPFYGDMGLAKSKDGIDWESQFEKPILTKREVKKGGIFFTSYV